MKRCVAAGARTSSGQCTECGAGRYQASEGQGSCTGCPAGRYHGSSGASSAWAAPVSATSPTSSTLEPSSQPVQITSTREPPGLVLRQVRERRRANVQSAVPAHTRTARKYSSLWSASVRAHRRERREAWQASVMSHGPEAVQSALCSLTGRCDRRGQSACIDCPAGRFHGSSGERTSSGQCTVCGAGTYQETAGQSSCTGCPAGRYAASEGQRTSADECTVCGSGTYEASAGYNTHKTPCLCYFFSSLVIILRVFFQAICVHRLPCWAICRRVYQLQRPGRDDRLRVLCRRSVRLPQRVHPRSTGVKRIQYGPCGLPGSLRRRRVRV